MEQPVDDERVDAPAEVRAEIQAPAQSLGSSEASVTARMGVPTSRSVERKPDRRDASSADSMTTLSYPNADIEIFESLSGQRHSR